MDIQFYQVDAFTDKVFRIRWFTPKVEVDLCGHVTLASGYVLFNHLNYKEEYIRLESRSGRLNVKKDKGHIFRKLIIFNKTLSKSTLA